MPSTPRGLRHDGRIDAHQFAAGVDQGAAGVARVDGRIGLDEIFECRQAQLSAARGADDAVGDGLRQPQGIADRQHDIPDLQLVGMPEGHDRQVIEVHFQQRQIRVRIPAHHLGHGHTAVGQLHPHLIGVFDDVIVGGDVALRCRR